MNILDSANYDVRKTDEAINSIALALALIVVMAAITNWAIKNGGSDPVISLVITAFNAAIGMVYATNHKVWAAQLSGYNHHERWSKEQMKLACIAAFLVLGCLGAAFFGLKYGMGVDQVFGTLFLLMTLPLARLARNAINSRGAVSTAVN